MKRLLFILVVSLLVFGSGIGCGPSYSEEGFEYVDNYAGEIIPAIEAALFRLVLWAEDMTDEGILADLKKSSDEINEINDRYWTDEFPEYEEVEEWMLKRIRGDEEWSVDGKELARALWNVEDDSDWLAGDLQHIYEAGGEISESYLATVVSNAEFALESMEELRWILYRK